MKLLILLVGSNPLPLYATAKFLIQPNTEIDDEISQPERIMFICTNDTCRYVENLCAVLKISKEMNEIVNLEDNGRKPLKIREEIINELDELFKGKLGDRHIIHLNYIGGTKPMAVQTVLALSEWIEDKPNIKFVLSDVDPELDKIIISDSGVGLPINRELGDFVKLSTQELLQLHGMNVTDQGRELPSFHEGDMFNFCRELLNNYQSSDSIKFNSAVKSLNSLYNQIKREERDPLKLEDRLKIDTKIEQKLNFFKAKIPSFATLLEKPHLSTTEKIVFLTGGWVEELVQNSLINLQNNPYLKINEIRRNITAEFNNRSTEIDVVAICGYRLFLFSCTSANQISLVKQKAFEALYRATQLGGEHAKAIIVSNLFNNYNNNEADDSLQNIHNLKELGNDLMQFDAERNCRLIGRDELIGEIQGENLLTETIKHILEGGR